jgi:hypothetical protein
MADNTKAGEMTHVSSHVESVAAQRQRLGAQVDDMTVAELREAADTLQVDTAGATKKQDLQRVVRDATRTTNSGE